MAQWKSKCVQPGETCCYTAAFLRSTGGGYEWSMRRGIVLEIRDGEPLVLTVQWNDTDEPSGVFARNVARLRTVAATDPHYRQEVER